MDGDTRATQFLLFRCACPADTLKPLLWVAQDNGYLLNGVRSTCVPDETKSTSEIVLSVLFAVGLPILSFTSSFLVVIDVPRRCVALIVVVAAAALSVALPPSNTSPASLLTMPVLK